MIAWITNTAKNAFTFLSSAKAPPSAPIELREAMKRENHFASKKFFIAVTAFVGLLFFYFSSVAVLFFLPEDNRDMVSGYVTIFTKTIEVLAIIIAAYLGVQTIADFSYKSTSTQSYDATVSVEQIEEKIITEETVKYQEIYKDDPSYAPIEWVMSYE
jgi:quinol-cytochrome oxidoreductase complex cytochrome b subunit